MVLVTGEEYQENKKFIPCHKIVLSAFSPYFKAMFSSNLIETKTNKVNMSNTDYSTLNDVINYAYCGSIYLNVNNVQNIFSLASLLQVKDLTNACSDFMVSNLDIYNSIDVYSFSKRYLNDYLMKKSIEFINRNFNSIITTNDFLQIDDINLLIDLMSNDDLDIECEDTLLEYEFKWINFNLNQRKTFIDKLILSTIRFNLIEKKALNDFILLQNDLLINSEKLCNLINDILNSNSSITNEFIENKYGINLKWKKRAGMSKAKYCFLLIGGNCDLDDGYYVNCFNPFNGDKYIISRSFVEKKNFLSKGYFHIENPGACVTADNKIFIGRIYLKL